MMRCLSSKERLGSIFNGKTPDRTPILGGWIACPEHICKITNRTQEEYWENPIDVTIDAYRTLGTDGLIDIYVPLNETDFRTKNINNFWRTVPSFSTEEAIEMIDKMPNPENLSKNLDNENEYEILKRDFINFQCLCKDILYMPAQWDNAPKIMWSDLLGYENLLVIIGLYPEKIAKLIRISSIRAFCRNNLLAKAIEEGLFPHAVLLGEDICDQRGPMISPDFLEKHYVPELKYSIQPLLDVGCKPVWHSDGNILPIIDLLIDSGIKGFQGFQSECGVSIEFIAQKRTSEGNPLIVFGPLSVATEMVHLSPMEIRKKVREARSICQDNAYLAIFTSNTINPDVPLENIYAMYEAVLM